MKTWFILGADGAIVFFLIQERIVKLIAEP